MDRQFSKPNEIRRLAIMPGNNFSEKIDFYRITTSMAHFVWALFPCQFQQYSDVVTADKQIMAFLSFKELNWLLVNLMALNITCSVIMSLRLMAAHLVWANKLGTLQAVSPDSFENGPGRPRTCDRPVMSRWLFQLSYGPKFWLQAALAIFKYTRGAPLLSMN